MSLPSGSRLGAYEIVSLLGEGGMGEVYRAKDTTLDREVAIKILPGVFAHDAERVARFTREAKTLASLNHPNIAQIYGVGEQALPNPESGIPSPGSVSYLVMELVEGDDLSTIIARHAGVDGGRGVPSALKAGSPGMSAGSKDPASTGSRGARGLQTPGMPLADVLPIARQIAEALEAAHEQGIVHRDLKPANIKVRADGTVKVLDFGLAKAFDAGSKDPASTGSRGARGLQTPGMPLADVLPIARQIAEALEAAHEQGIVHRDLKPANIKVRADGTVKVLDFGLAKAFDAGSKDPASISNGANSPTLTAHATQMGLIIGTAAYMAPEQAKGKSIDKRADIWAYGVVLYEMLTGRGAFPGDDVSETLASVLKSEPDWSALPGATPPSLRRLLRRCLERDAKLRLRDIGEARIALSDTSVAGDAVAMPATVPRSAARWPLVAVLTVVALGIGLALGAFVLRRSPAAVESGVARFGIDVEAALHLGADPLAEQTQARPRAHAFALSPDGRHVVYVGHNGTVSQLYHRALDQDRAVPLPGTDGALMPVFSPDSREVLFFSRQGIKRVAIAGGPARTITVSSASEIRGAPSRGATWSDDDRIVTSWNGDIIRFPAGGGAVEALIAAVSPERLAFPEVLPGGRAVLFNVERGSIPSRWDIVVESVGSKDRQVVVSGGSHPRYVDSGHVLFMRGGAILAVPFDVATLRTTGEPVQVVENVMHSEQGGADAYRTGLGHFGVSRTGVLAYLPGGLMRISESTFVWVDRQGAAQPLPIPPARSLRPAIAPDGGRLAWARGPDGERQIWFLDVGPGVSRPVTRGGDFYRPVWSPDGKRLAVAARRDDGLGSMAVLDADGSAAPQFFGPTGANSPSPADWSVNNVLAFLDREVWTMLMDGSGQPAKFFESGGSLTNPRFSPDGRFLSYGSNETGTLEVYVRPFPAGTPITRVSVNGGFSSAWSPDGRELFYRQGSGEQTRMMAVPISIDDGFRQLGPPRELFSGDYGSSWPLDSWDLSPDGRFIMLKGVSRPDDPPFTRINLVLNWFAELNRLAPEKK